MDLRKTPKTSDDLRDWRDGKWNAQRTEYTTFPNYYDAKKKEEGKRKNRDKTHPFLSIHSAYTLYFSRCV